MSNEKRYGFVTVVIGPCGFHVRNNDGAFTANPINDDGLEMQSPAPFQFHELDVHELRRIEMQGICQQYRLIYDASMRKHEVEWMVAPYIRGAISDNVTALEKALNDAREMLERCESDIPSDYVCKGES